MGKSKRRTKKDKQLAKHNFVFNNNQVSWKESAKNESGEAVNRHLENSPEPKNNKPTEREKAVISRKEEYFALTKNRMIRSVVLVSFILALEVVIYLAWNIKR